MVKHSPSALLAVPPSNVLPALSQNIRSHEDLPGKSLMVQVGSTTWFARSGMRAPATGQAGRTFCNYRGSSDRLREYAQTVSG